MAFAMTLLASMGPWIAVPVAAGAQETIASDRPCIGSGSGIVAPGVVQVEAGVTLGGGPSGTELPVGQALVRVEAVSLSLQGLALVPSGTATRRTDQWLFGLNALADVPVSDRVAVNVNMGVLAGEEGTPVWSANVTPSYAFGRRASGYLGWAGTFTSGNDVNFAEAG